MMLGFVFPHITQAVWVWSPETGEWTNPEDHPKDTPQQQFDYAVEYYEKEDYPRALDEFKKLTKAYPKTKMAAEGQFYQGQTFEKMEDIGKASDAYQILVDRYPYSDRLGEAIEREFEIAEAMMAGQKTKILGMDVMPAQSKAVELYQHIVRSAPYGPYGARAQYRLGDALVVMGELDLARKAYQDVIDNYPNSEYETKARYQVAQTWYQSAQEEEYHIAAMDEAIKKFEGFTNTNPRSELRFEANKMISELRNKKAENLYSIADFYHRIEKFSSAKVYYQDVIGKFPDAPAALRAKNKLDEIDARLEGKTPPQGANKPWWRKLI
jgi:outer membrane protein assembly factor BamD